MKPAVKNTITKLAWLIGMISTVIVVFSAVDNTKDARTQGVEVEIEALPNGKYLINDEDIKELIKAAFDSDLVGEKVESIDVERLEVELKEEGFVLDAEAYIDASQTIKIIIKQRQPILRVLDSNGLDYYLDGFGVKMEPSKHYTARVLVATGSLPAFTNDYLKREEHPINRLFDLTNVILKDDFLNPLVEQVHYNKKEFTIVPKVGDHKIIIGNLNDLDDKIERLKIFYQEGMSRTGWQRYKELDLRYEGQVVARK